MNEICETNPAMLSVRDITEDVSLCAMNMGQMKIAQSQLANWFRGKLSVLEGDLSETEAALNVAEENKWATGTFKSQITRLKARMRFYEKCAIAAEAGYCIVPNMPCDLFAVRTNRIAPRRNDTTQSSAAREARSESPAAGLGEYVDDATSIQKVRESECDPVTKRLTVPALFTAAEWGDEIDFPISVCKPEVMSATAQAMAMKVFDEIAVVDDGVSGSGVNANRSAQSRRGDPLVIGIIRNPDRTQWNDKRLSFLIAWHIDTRTL